MGFFVSLMEWCRGRGGMVLGSSCVFFFFWRRGFCGVCSVGDMLREIKGEKKKRKRKKKKKE